MSARWLESNRGRAYIGPTPGPGPTIWRAHHEDTTGRMTEVIDGDTLDDLIGWARERTGWVLVIDTDGTFRWAGTDPRPADITSD